MLSGLKVTSFPRTSWTLLGGYQEGFRGWFTKRGRAQNEGSRVVPQRLGGFTVYQEVETQQKGWGSPEREGRGREVGRFPKRRQTDTKRDRP